MQGELECEFDENTIRHFDFLTRKTGTDSELYIKWCNMLYTLSTF